MKNPFLLAIFLVGALALQDTRSREEERLTFIDKRLEVVYPVIQGFKSLITLDPFKVTQTWIGSEICSYRGFHCDNPPDNKTAVTVASIDFNGFQLFAPSIEGFIDQLPDLALFHANSNNFGGTVPSKIVNLKYLYELDISNNKFTGQFPTAVVGMPGLTFLDIRFNSFSGSIPPQIFGQNLDVLFINDNTFTASLPEIPGDSHILFLTLADNKFNGPLPRSILRSMTTLTERKWSSSTLLGISCLGQSQMQCACSSERILSTFPCLITISHTWGHGVRFWLKEVFLMLGITVFLSSQDKDLLKNVRSSLSNLITTVLTHGFIVFFLVDILTYLLPLLVILCPW